MKYEENIDLRLSGQVHSKTNGFKKKLNQAKRYINEAFSLFKKPYLSLSGGKDSVAMLAVVNDVATVLNRDFNIWSHVSDASFPGTIETIKECAEKTGRFLILDESPVSAFDVIGKQSHQQFGKTGFFFDSIKKQAETHDLAFVGVRAAESKRRTKACKVHGPLFKTHTPAYCWTCQPVCWWSIYDVAAALFYYDMPIHPIYDKFSTEIQAIRLGYITSLDLIEKNTMIFLKKNYHKEYQKLIIAAPYLKDYAI